MSGEWSREQATEWAEAQTWRFTGYYKFNFTYTAIDGDSHKGYIGTAVVGGPSGDDIYKLELNAEMRWSDLYDEETSWYIHSPDGAPIFEDL